MANRYAKAGGFEENGKRIPMNDPSKREEEKGAGRSLSIATMSESQFQDSLDALILNVPSANRLENSTPPLEAAEAPPQSIEMIPQQPLEPQPVTTAGILNPSAVAAAAAAFQFLVPTAPTSNTSAPPLSPPPVSSTAMQPPLSRKRKSFPNLCSEDEDEQEKRRQGRNHREQQRAHQITQQITNLRTLLQKSNLTFKPDKFSTLVMTENYIKDLQKRGQDLTSEHSKLLKTISETSEHLAQAYAKPEKSPEQQSEKLISGINYKWIFEATPMAVSVTSIDGRFIDCNALFEDLTKFKKQTLLSDSLSIFNVLHRSSIETIFCKMSKMLSSESDADSFVESVQLGRSSEEVRTTHTTQGGTHKVVRSSFG